MVLSGSDRRTSVGKVEARTARSCGVQVVYSSSDSAARRQEPKAVLSASRMDCIGCGTERRVGSRRTERERSRSWTLSVGCRSHGIRTASHQVE